MARIVLIVPVFPQLSETFIVQKLLGLLERGWDVYVLCSSSPEGQWKDYPQLKEILHGHRRVQVAWPTGSRAWAAFIFPFVLFYTFVLAPAPTLRYLKRGWKRFGLDILHRFYLDAKLIALRPTVVHFEFGALAVGRMYLRELLNARVTISFRGHDLNFSGLEDPNYYQDVWAHADAIHLLGKYLWEQAQRRGCPPALPHTLIAPSLAVEHFVPRGDREIQVVGTFERPLRILSVGRLVWSKGYEYSLHSVRLLTERGIVCEYRIVGGGNLLDAIAFSRHQFGLEDIVKLLGPQPLSEVKKEMGWADVFVHSAVEEGFCNAVIEAQAMKLPVVSSDAGGLPENVQDGITGFVVQRRNAEAMTERLILLAASSGLRMQMGEAGRRRVLSRFALSSQIQRFEAFYGSVL